MGNELQASSGEPARKRPRLAGNPIHGLPPPQSTRLSQATATPGERSLETPIPLPPYANPFANLPKGSQPLLPTISSIARVTYSTSPIPLPSYATPAASSQVATQVSTPSSPRPTFPKPLPAKAHGRIQPHKPINGLDTSSPQPPYVASLPRRPYLASSDRDSAIEGTLGFIEHDSKELPEPRTFHVDFTDEEVQQLIQLITNALGLPTPIGTDTRRILHDIYKQKRQACKDAILKIPPYSKIPSRTSVDILSFLRDLSRRKASTVRRTLSLAYDSFDKYSAILRSSRVNSLLLARECVGHRGYGPLRSPQNFMNEFRKAREDGLELCGEWTNCAGDINTITWVSNDGFLCGTTEHSDSHNQQYNKPGNLVVGSCSAGTLQAYPDHRIVRPIIERGENSTAEMRESQEPWLYTSVVCSDYDSEHDMAYTSSFDRTVKVWRVDKSGKDMSLLGTWNHDGNVNFVVASKHPSGMVATAADVHADAVRVYSDFVDRTDVSGSNFRSFSCSRVVDDQGRAVSTEKWAYYPATIQWGRCPEVGHLLLVGYSPRSRTQDDNDIPEDRRGTGELCLWNPSLEQRWKLVAGSTLNVFEVMWHPTQACFIAATSPQGPVGSELDTKIRTQIRVFRRSHEPNTFVVSHTLDCTAMDINELSIMPNSLLSCYIAAGCTDGRTYVWDTALGDKPIHVLKHSKPMEDFRADDHAVDPGVKFCAWGNTLDRFYTGSSDGVVKVWNVRAKTPFVRNLLDVPAPVSFGKFSPDKSRLLIGDASGRVFFLSVDEDDKLPATFLPLGSSLRRCPRFVKLHPEPAAPAEHFEDYSGPGIAKQYLERGQLVLAGNPTIGAVQGPNYQETGLFEAGAHDFGDITKELAAAYMVSQQIEKKATDMWKGRAKQRLMLKEVSADSEIESKHRGNVARDFDPSLLSLPDLQDLISVKAEVYDSDVDYNLDEEDEF